MANIFEYLDWRGDLTFSNSKINSVDSLILCCISYIGFDDIVKSNKKIKLADAVKIYSELPEETRVVRAKEDEDFVFAAAKTKRFGELLLSEYVNHFDSVKEKQFSAITVSLDSENTFVAFRGTDNTIVGWKEDFNMSFLEKVPAQKDAVDYLEEVSSKFKGYLYVGGHSKGGNLAVYASAHCSQKTQSRIKAVFNNDGPGFNNSTINYEGYRAIIDRIETYVPQSSVVGMLLEHQESYTVIHSTQVGILQHDPYSWEVLGTDFIKLESITQGSKMLDRALSQWLSETTADERERFVNALFAVLGGTDTSISFSPSASWLKNTGLIIQQWHDTSPKTRLIVRQTFKAILDTAFKTVRNQNK